MLDCARAEAFEEQVQGAGPNRIAGQAVERLVSPGPERSTDVLHGPRRRAWPRRASSRRLVRAASCTPGLRPHHFRAGLGRCSAPTACPCQPVEEQSKQVCCGGEGRTAAAAAAGGASSAGPGEDRSHLRSSFTLNFPARLQESEALSVELAGSGLCGRPGSHRGSLMIVRRSLVAALSTATLGGGRPKA